jgi:DNA modification methylase
MQNTLFYGDHLDILRQFVEDASVDLVYLDPPVNSNKARNFRRIAKMGGSSSPVIGDREVYRF